MHLHTPAETPLEFVYSRYRYPLTRCRLPSLATTPRNHERIATFLGDTILTTDEFATYDPLPMNLSGDVHLVLVGGVAFPGIRATLFAGVPLHSAAKDDEPWQNTPRTFDPEGGAGPFSQLGIGLVPLGPIDLIESLRRFPHSLIDELESLLYEISAQRAAPLGDQIVTALGLES